MSPKEKMANLSLNFMPHKAIKVNRKFFTGQHDVLDMPNLIEAQIRSYKWFWEKGLKELVQEINSIKDFTGKNLELFFGDYYLDKPKYDEKTAKDRNTTFEAPLYVSVKLVNKVTGKTKTQDVYLGDFPLMTPRGTFVINGVERVVVSQLVKSPGVFFSGESVRGRNWYGAKIIPNRGAWLELETDINGIISVKIDRKRRIPISALMRVFKFTSDEEMLAAVADVDTNPDMRYMQNTLEKDPSKTADEGFKEVYKRIRPGDLATVDNARSLIEAMFFNADRYDLSEVGRYKLNQRLNIKDRADRVLTKSDLTDIVREVIRLNNSQGAWDDIDHLSNRRVKSVGELIQGKFRIGLARMSRIAKDRMSLADIETVTPAQLIHVRPIVAVIQEFFSSSQLSQFMDQTNPLAELEHKRRLSAMGPGGLSRERAGFEVRDVHRSHYGRLCPITTPEGPNIGLVAHLASYARINDFGFIETPYRKAVKDKSGRRQVTDEIVYLDAYEEQFTIIAQASAQMDEHGYFMEERTSVRVHGEPSIAETAEIDYVEVSPKQIISVTTSLIPFLEHDDANRALMGSNMQRQAVSCIKPDAPVIGTGVEAKAAYDSGQVAIAENDGVVTSVTGDKIVIAEKNGKKREYPLLKFVRSNTSTSINQHPIVKKGQDIKAGQPIADGAAIQNAELALGQNLLVAFVSWEGGNYEDAILISSRVVEEDRYSSIHIEDFKVDIRDTKLGPEIITRDIPNVGEEKLKDLDENGVIRIGAQVKAGDILVGKITPKGETDLTAEEKLLRVIFGEKSRDVKDTSLTLPHGEYGKVVHIREFSREQGDKLPSGVIKSIQVSVAVLRKIQVGDKMAGRHGNKGVISQIIPVENMPFMADGTPMDIILNPLGVASRMNIGQILETHLGLAAKKLGYNVATPPLDGVPEETIRAELKKAGFPEDGKVVLYDGKSGDQFVERVTVGVIYMLKLHHLVDDKMHARSTGPYSLITQQPLGGKAQFGGQRFGEMEVWALEGYGAAHTLQEMLTIKSDDVVGRAKTYESIVKGEPIKKPNVPESFRVLVKELQSLGLNVELIGEKLATDEAAPTGAGEIQELATTDVRDEAELKLDDKPKKKKAKK
ncbi:MAG: DNA-directed RNA polymerase subunit beta [Candidatus Doudnabacteria bacterium RIFCSPLOWO2_02_FULL_49_13]|uniref:DNA-directed RNA polymerase subunit beta n=1 Tax=Candidatus Doudnabacteria bacterium RIFCSPHIGHO2_12_FULL_48_16 TaxID=1817838 RepID=A0A1F5PK72_9BACT|nr:MAG: DNA-directed RNA polymerase subunit beta [Candidatus Doudnabacteria bacterium RIFCSPHIGHO2_02_FULL_49_24]OGE88519.1 MAG: DNA-directed RNA polymerase subunit beta [Candidatus Doudnabacteria bacterium RIFCSPHIGHO2_01_FULL_50_67]OGE90267.1 MAG: DNA-directed RNA polymerase subunit beta [Candidatus Doudnabacteria bacterium RIFCSPHIGHO2_12_FULL_48_16]OGE96923.1 MAG: DNA-directed RNA polymerase subunit beta [Candidatus Doudnabacteria bacterium RIFCSPLOWO2_01_FULL_49_40]OGF02323.1 MAG: DNA-dire